MKREHNSDQPFTDPLANVQTGDRLVYVGSDYPQLIGKEGVVVHAGHVPKHTCDFDDGETLWLPEVHTFIVYFRLPNRHDMGHCPIDGFSDDFMLPSNYLERCLCQSS